MSTAKELNENTQDDSMDERLYSFANLDQYTFKQRIIIRLAGFLLYWLIRVICSNPKHKQRQG